MHFVRIEILISLNISYLIYQRAIISHYNYLIIGSTYVTPGCMYVIEFGHSDTLTLIMPCYREIRYSCIKIDLVRLHLKQ